MVADPYSLHSGSDPNSDTVFLEVLDPDPDPGTGSGS
jgi:hypothetical protein